MDLSMCPIIPVALDRPTTDQSWGFRLQGGADFRLPLSVKKVTTNSAAHNKIFPGDGIVSINGRDANSMKHEDAQELIRKSLQLQLVLRRGQFAFIRPSKAPIKFGPSATPQVTPALNNTTTPYNYRRF